MSVQEARERLAELIGEAASGQDVVIERGDGASVRLVPVVEPGRRPRRFGFAAGLVEMADDFDAPLDDFAPYVR